MCKGNEKNVSKWEMVMNNKIYTSKDSVFSVT